MWLGLVQSVEGLNTAKRLTLSQVRKFFLPINWDIGSFPTFRLELKHRLFLGLKPVGLKVGTTTLVLLVLRPSDTDWKESIGSPESPVCDSPCRSWVSPPYACDQFLLMSLSIHPIGSVWRMSTLLFTHADIWSFVVSAVWLSTGNNHQLTTVTELHSTLLAGPPGRPLAPPTPQPLYRTPNLSDLKMGIQPGS